jgi:hypothetical protein
MPYIFRLRSGFPKVQAAALAARRTFDDRELIRIGRRSREAGLYSPDDFLKISESATSTKLCGTNMPERIKRNTSIAISSTSERTRICAFMRLAGVSWYTASVFLHYTFENQYPTLSRRTLWSWGYDKKPGFVSFSFWSDYVQASRDLAEECHVTMRDLDRALRQYTTEQKDGPPPQEAARATSA